jgi:AcrR family transcriptional regulator
MNMVQTGRRARARTERRQAFLDAALRVVTSEGIPALTMQRLAADLDCAVGTAYTYFPSKGALLAEVQREAIERLTASYVALGPDVDEILDGEPSAVATLTHLVALGRFWVDAEAVYPQEHRLLQLLLSEATQPEHAVPDSEVATVLPAAERFLGLVGARIAAAMASGAINVGGDAAERTVLLAASLNGVLQAGNLVRFNPELLDSRRLAMALLDDLLTGWGADPGALAAAHAHTDSLSGSGPLARPLPSEDR